MEQVVLVMINTKGQMQTQALNFAEGVPIFLGRDLANNDIVISDGIVSKRHGCLIKQGDTFYYRDFHSRNGTYVEGFGERKFLHNSDELMMLPEGAVLRIGAINNPEKMVLLCISYMAGEEQLECFNAMTNTIQIGRTAENDIVLNSPGVSRQHCRIEYTAGGAVLYDNKSVNGVMVNGESIEGSRFLRDKDVIQILGYQLFFSGNCIYYKKRVRGVPIKVSNINKWVGKKNNRKRILRDVNCEIKGNSFVAIIGGSGAGKTTLMNVINGFDEKYQGNVYCNNIDLKANFQHLKNIIGYVPQEDIIYENLTLRKMLYYTAKLKMPDDTAAAEIESGIDEVLGIIGLTKHQDTYIKKLSGGQKKRASIAVELLADPKLFFLDEPTSGLDPGTEKNLMLSLKQLTETQDKTVIMVTHTTQNLHLCDKVIFMGPGGRLCFAGNVQQAKAFFGKEDLTDIYNLLADDAPTWERQYKKYQKQETHTVSGGQKEAAVKKPRASAVRQFGILVKRYMELTKNDAQRLGVLLMQPVIIGVLLYIVANDDIFEIYESTKSMMFALSCSAIWIGVFDSIQEVCKERNVLKREYMAGLKLPGYVLSKVLILGILGFVQALCLTATFLWLVGAEKDGILFSNFFFEILLTVWITVLASIAIGLLISSLVKTGDKAMAIAPFVLILQLLFSGILFSLEGLGEWISYCTISRWSVEALGSIANLNQMELRLQEDIPNLAHEAESFFEATAQHLTMTWETMAGISVIFIIASIVLLRNIAKDGR